MQYPVLRQKEFDLLEKPLREIDSTIEKFMQEHDDLIEGTRNIVTVVAEDDCPLVRESGLFLEPWPYRSLLIKRTHKNILREIGVTLEETQQNMIIRLIEKRTYKIFGRVYLCYDDEMPAYKLTTTIEEGIKAPLDPKLVYQSLEEAYKAAKSITEEDLREGPECLKRIIEYINNPPKRIKSND